MSTASAQRSAAEDYLYANSIPQLLTDLTADLARNRPSDPLSFLINALEKRRNTSPSPSSTSTTTTTSSTSSSTTTATTTASNGMQRVIFVLGGPGSGKGTVCARLVSEKGFVHLSAGDLLREEQARPGSQYGEMIARYIREGQIVPKEVTIGLLKNAMAAAPQSTTFLIDGFPRAMDQAVAFEDSVQRCDFVLFLECPEETMEARLLKRGETSGRADDNAESIKKRFRTYVEQTMPVIEYFGRDNRVRTVSSVPPAQEVYQQVSTLF